jgi:uncharacterized membrane protein
VSALLIVQLVSVFTTGLLAGIFFGDRMGNSYARPKLPPSAFVTFQQVQNVRFARMMPLPILAALVSDAMWLVLLRGHMDTRSFGLVAGGTLALFLALAITRVVNIPINNRLARWSPASPPSDFTGTWERWERFHTVRTILAVLSFALMVFAFGLEL